VCSDVQDDGWRLRGCPGAVCSSSDAYNGSVAVSSSPADVHCSAVRESVRHLPEFDHRVARRCSCQVKPRFHPTQCSQCFYPSILVVAASLVSEKVRKGLAVRAVYWIQTSLTRVY